METIYPNKCCQCGMCCLSETCPIGQTIHQIAKTAPCPSLYFFNDIAYCALAERGLVPVGDGCCIKARAYKDGVEFDYASLPDDLKHRAVQDRLKHAIR
jgi:hypothetical protein